MRALRGTFPRGQRQANPPPRWLSGLWVLGFCAMGVGASGCGKPVDQSECDRMLDRYVEFLMHNEDPEVPFEEVRRKQREARVKAGSTPEFASCPDRVSRKQYECAMQAPNADRLEQCLVF